MSQPSAEKIAQRAVGLSLLDDRQVREIWATIGNRNVATEDFVQFLVRREYLTNYQVEHLLKGDRTGYFYGPYKVQYLVGEGTFARVFRAVHKKTGDVVALKVLRSKFSENPTQFNQFLREGKVGCSLRHPNLVCIHDVAAEGDTLYMVMEFVEGRNLREFVKIRRKIEAGEATRLTIDMADGLRYAFEHGLTHRDLKMTNVLVSSRGQAKLVDFGLATMDDSLSENVSDVPSARTVDYAALEQATGVRRDDVRSDIYFLGCIYYHMLTGEPPLPETPDRIARLTKSRFHDITPIRVLESNIPDSVALVVNKAMMLDVGRRYQSPSAMLVDLRIAAQRLADEASGVGARPKQEGTVEPQFSVMVVESNVPMQDIFRKGLRNAGYRVLVTADPVRALDRLCRDHSACDCVIFNAQELAESAVNSFNAMADHSWAGHLPAILLLDEPQRDWAERATSADWRIVLCMPITMGRLRENVAKLLASAKARR